MLSAKPEDASNPHQVTVGFTTAPDSEVARKLARSLVESRLVACVNLLPQVESVYRWQGAIESASEVLLVLKTVAQHHSSLRQLISQLHPYDVPELLFLPVSHGLPGYLAWVVNETRTKDNDEP